MDRFVRRKLEDSIAIPASDISEKPLDTLSLALLKVFQFSSFRKNQKEICSAVLENEDLFVIMPTGGGKTLCYALPATLSKGVTVVISPLISLIEDQVSALIQLPSGGIPAAFLTSSASPAMAASIFADLNRCLKGNPPYLKLLYITPERLLASIQNKDFLATLYNNEYLSRFVVDEAHCVSSWGHDFRKDYARLGILKEHFPDIPIVCLTATAREKVVEDVVKILRIPSCRRISSGYDRPNLLFEVRAKPSSVKDTYALISDYIHNGPYANATGIVYCMTRKDTEELADYLRDSKLKADYYHAGQSPRERKLVQQAWLRGEVKIVCATIAYGMGIDKPDVRYVLHMTVAKSIEGYYQEAGRAGRDGLRSECILYYNSNDIKKLGRLMMKPPARKLSKKDQALLEEMQEYCEESVECRRRMFSRKFGETEKSREGGILVKQFTACGSMCDNCLLHKNRHHIMRSVDLGEQHDTSGVKNGKGVKRRLLPATQSTFSSKKTSAPPIPSLGFRSARTQLILEAKENEGNRNIDESWLSATVRR